MSTISSTSFFTLYNNSKICIDRSIYCCVVTHLHQETDPGGRNNDKEREEKLVFCFSWWGVHSLNMYKLDKRKPSRR